MASRSGLVRRDPTFGETSLTPRVLVAEEAVRTHGEVVPSAFMNIRNVVVKQPISTSLTVLSYLYIPIPVSILTPWNFPSAMITRKLGAALAAGCTAVIKPPTETPCSALVLVEVSPGPAACAVRRGRSLC
ncbi:hypothetical protein BD310DRAFT_137163 [Dichomitus squalens]|uniref:Aldehyde dehydrogenase domain-containing protein n=1 Tax=Dichomitus squalens TaxID=114155 RepID=A0A4Q9PF96_9APHY|nr:hypothetical protein BD310DRAFT_137163 [Dichomitus squalens]